ncbi:MAG TPA: hypothetical protein V6D17_15785 [Candidatus Obscuribacterales bacterium]
MYAYLIIAAELLILYTVFWYVFIREPKPYKIRGNPWGHYDGAHEICHHECEHAHVHVTCYHRVNRDAHSDEVKQVELRSVGGNFVKLPCAHLQHQFDCTSGFKVHDPAPARNTAQYGWVVARADERRDPLSTMLSNLIETIGRLSVKLP